MNDKKEEQDASTIQLQDVSNVFHNESEEKSEQLEEKENPRILHQMEHFVRIKGLVKRAIELKHTFTAYGRSRVIRECLLARGWCEKLPGKAGSSDQHQLSVDSSPLALLTGIGNLNESQNEQLLTSKMLTSHIVDFIWNAGYDRIVWPLQNNKTTICNRFTRASFTSKIGLCANMRQMHWYYEDGIAETHFPRCYNLSQPEQMHSFVDDFRLTACLSLLKWFLDQVTSGGEESIRSSTGIVPLRALEFAIGRCSDFISNKSHNDIDQEVEKVWSHQWEQFISWYYKLVHGGAQFIANNVSIQKYTLATQHLLKKAKKFWPQFEMDGSMNIWIVKPGNKSRGRGIVLMNKLDDILAKANPTNKTTDTRFVVQKYIERPLLIYETKFDIRQWFIVTNAQPLTIWMFKESYLRFCSQKFSLVDFHESIHLSNNAVQCKYKNSTDRDARLPVENMWDATTFQEYLKSRGDENAWTELIYPGIKQSLVGSLLASQDTMDRRKNSFELYGADFMVMEDFSVWLIEINSNPNFGNSSSVTTRLCKKALEDMIKVVIDYRENQNAETGDFELAYKQKLPFCQAHLGTGLSLHGTRITAPEEKRTSFLNSSTTPQQVPWTRRKAIATSHGSSSTSMQPTTIKHLGPVLIDLIEELEIQLNHEFYEYMRHRSNSGLINRHLLPLVPRLPERKRSIDPGSKQYSDVQTNTSTLKNIIFLPTDSNVETSFPPKSSSAVLHPILDKSLKSGMSSKKRAKHKTSARRCVDHAVRTVGVLNLRKMENQ